MADAPDPPMGGAAAAALTAREFFAAQQALFLRTLQDARRQPQRLAEGLLARAFDSFHGNLGLHCAGEPAPACGKGCASCCSLRVAATAPEVWLVARFLAWTAPRLAELGIDVRAQVRRADAATRGLGEAQRVVRGLPCPFIAKGACIIHRVRPLACRGHASHDVKACVDAAAGRATAVPYSQGHRRVRALVQNALQSALRDGGLAWQLYELNHALVLAFDHPGAEAAWLAGEDVLAPAALHEVPAAEMARVFDALRAAGPATAQ